MGVAGFSLDIRQWKTREEFRAHLYRHDPAIVPWVQGATIHHTWSPTPDIWKGQRSVLGMVNYYRKQGWPAGPHLYVVLGANFKGSPRPEYDGIWQMTPLNLQGIHAQHNHHNYTHWGIEVVGDFDKKPWSNELRELVYGVVEDLFRWKRISVNKKSLLGHRETGSPKTCPGTAINMDRMRIDVALRLR